MSEDKPTYQSGGYDSVAIGPRSNAIGECSTAIGTDSQAAGGGSVALGWGSLATEPCTVSVGSGNTYMPETRRIVNVTDGRDDQDAVTVAQLRREIETLRAEINAPKGEVK